MFIRWKGGNKMTYGKITTTMKEVEELLIPSDDIKEKLDGAVHSALPDKGCEVVDGELSHE